MFNLKYFKLCLTALSLILYLAQPLPAWDCNEAHPSINLLAFHHFKARLMAGHFKDKFRNFGLDDQIKYQGLTFAKAVNFSSGEKAQTVNGRYTFSEWLARGGFDADMPQIRMGFRHFYDPVYEPRYLTWQHLPMLKPKKSKFANEKAFFDSLDYRADDWNHNIEFGIKNRKIRLQPKFLRPEIDAITWAFEHEENDYNWHQGLLAYKAAMENDTAMFNGLNRSQMFGKAFRALGETMHLMSDMSQPAHTRADSHSLYEPIEMNVKAEIIRKVIGDRYLDPNFKPVPEFTIEDDLEPAERMKKLAAFTNRHFFSNDTIFDYEKWYFPRRKKRPYASPQLSKLKHEKGIYYAWFETVGWVPLAKETGSIFSKVSRDSDKYGRKNPHFNVMPDMAEAQAKVLMPLAIYNSATLIRDFLPSFKVDFALKRLSNDTWSASGELIHETYDDKTWQEIGEIRFNGPGFIQINKSFVRCEFRYGRLVDTQIKADSGDRVILVVRAGGMIVTSRPVTIP